MSAVELVRLGRYVVEGHHHGAVRYFVGHHLVAHDLRQRLGGWVARSAVSMDLGSLARSALLFGFGRQRAPSPPWPPEIRELMEEALLACGLEGVQCRVSLVEGDARPETSWRGLAFGFDVGDPCPGEPVVVLKLRVRDPGYPALATEWHALREMRADLPRPLRATLPEPLNHRARGGMEVIATTLVPGRPVYLDLHNRVASAAEAARHLTAVATWLASFQDATVESASAVEDGRGLAVRPGGRVPQEWEWLERLRERLALDPLPLVPSHGDLWARNVLLDRGAVSGVVDWEHWRRDSLPTCDLFHFLITYALTVRWRPLRPTSPLTAFRRAFVDETRVARAVRRALCVYAQARRMSLPMLEGLCLLHLASPVAVGRRASFPSAEHREAAFRLLHSARRSVFSP